LLGGRTPHSGTAKRDIVLGRFSGSPRRAELGRENLPAHIGLGQQRRINGAQRNEMKTAATRETNIPRAAESLGT
jgi:hypothetical protein